MSINHATVFHSYCGRMKDRCRSVLVAQPHLVMGNDHQKPIPERHAVILIVVGVLR